MEHKLCLLTTTTSASLSIHFEIVLQNCRYRNFTQYVGVQMHCMHTMENNLNIISQVSVHSECYRIAKISFRCVIMNIVVALD